MSLACDGQAEGLSRALLQLTVPKGKVVKPEMQLNGDCLIWGEAL